MVAHSRKPDVFACGFCHRADRPGGPENASLGGLSATSIVQQMADFRSGARTTSVPQRAPPTLMIALAEPRPTRRFAKLPPTSRRCGRKPPSGSRKPIWCWPAGSWRTQERASKSRSANESSRSPEDLQQFENRDACLRFIAYEPAGGTENGETLTTADAGKTVPCGICHGADLKGLGPIPGIAARSPSSVVRQLSDFQHGVRPGLRSALTKAVVAKLTVDDMVALAAYAGSLTP